MDGSFGIGTGAQRVRGAARVAAGRRSGADRLLRLRQEGSLKVLLPHAGPGGPVEAVLLNTAGGLTGGDRLSLVAEAEERARLRLSTQAAERAYRSDGGWAEVEARLAAGAGARVEWLPQETILYEGAALRRRLSVDLAVDARALLVEPVILGRRAMGEVVTRAAFRDRWEVRRDGSLVFADALRVEPEGWGGFGSPATLGGAGAWASLLLVAPEAEGLLGPLRAILGPRSGASLVRDGVLFARLLAEDGFQLRQALVPALERLAGPLPKVWRL